MTSTTRNTSLDALRVLSLFGIVALHVANGGFSDNRALGFVIDELCRFAVPVFFLLSAYFWKDRDLAAPVALASKVAKRVAPGFILIVLLTMAVNLATRGKPGVDLTPAGLSLLLWTGGPAFHLWFLPALVLGSFVVAGLNRLVGLRSAAIITLALFVVGTMIGAYSRPLLGHGFPFWMDRNGLFFAPVFLVAGVLLRQHADSVRALPLPAIAASVVLFALLQVAEGYFVVGRFPMGHDYSIATLGFGVAVAMLFMRLDLRSPLWSTLGQATFGAYLIHLLVMRMLTSCFGFGGNSPTLIGLTFAVSLGLALAFQEARSRLSAAARSA